MLMAASFSSFLLLLWVNVNLIRARIVFGQLFHQQALSSWPSPLLFYFHLAGVQFYPPKDEMLRNEENAVKQ